MLTLRESMPHFGLPVKNLIGPDCHDGSSDRQNINFVAAIFAFFY